MAKPNNLYHLTAATALIFLITCQSLSARPLNNGPGGSAPPEKESALPCDLDSEVSFDVGVPAHERVRGRYGPLVLTMLPKGTMVPPSGPSKQHNDDNN
ncbi:hypothetical protein CsSME_00028817 [Camellia sinensis var. sinensis]